MPSDDPKIEDDFEDIDFDDVGEDMDDESWDDFDEDVDAELAEDDLGEDDPFAEDEEAADAALKKGKGKKAKKAKSKGGKSGGSFTTILIAGAVIIGGGIAYYTMFSGGSAPVPALQPTGDQANDMLAETVPADAPPAQATAPEDSAFLDIEELSTDLPPMPAPVEGAMDEMAGTIEDIQNLDTDSLDLGDIDLSDGSDAVADAPEEGVAMEDEGVLTPMPDLDSMDGPELADLDFDDSQQQQEASMLADMQAIEEMAAEAEAATQDLESSMAELDSALQDLDTATQDLAAMSAQEMEMEMPVADSAPVEAPAENNDQAELKALVNDLNQQLSAKDESLDNATAENKALSSQLDKAESKISDLESKIASLQNQLKSAKSTSDAAPQPQEKTIKTTASDAATTKPAPVKTASPAPKPQKTYDWSLRSASPGRATLADQNGDMRSVEVGSSVPGLGRIESISVEGGKWVVKGAQGSVSQ